MRTAFVLVAFTACLTAAQPGEFEWRGTLARGRSVEIRGINGDIHALPSSSGEVEVVARVVSADQEPAEMKLHLMETGEGLAVCAIRPDQAACHPPGKEGAIGPGARVDFFVRVPEGVHFTGRTVNGGVDAESLHGDVAAFTVNGPVRISTTGSAHARTINGSITASLLNPFWRRSPRFSTVNGGITVAVPRNVSACIDAETRNGKVIADLKPLRGTVTDNSIQARVGGPAPAALTVRSVNGTIHLKHAL